jgi:hypothetical protein
VLLTVHLRVPPRLRISGAVCLLYGVDVDYLMATLSSVSGDVCFFYFIRRSNYSTKHNHGILVFHYKIQHVSAVFGRIINTSLCSLFELCSLRRRGLTFNAGIKSPRATLPDEIFTGDFVS